MRVTSVFLLLLSLGGCNKYAGMVQVPANESLSTSAFWIDSYEASLKFPASRGENGTLTTDTSKPPRAVSKSQSAPAVNIAYAEAVAACQKAGKRICTYDEWKAACVGPENLEFAFQESHDSPIELKSVCDVARTQNNTPGSLPSQTGANSECKTKGLELWDMIGNLCEWVDDNGTPRCAGVAFYQSEDKSNCFTQLVTKGSTSMEPSEAATDIGFRCCSDASE